jgi:ribosome-associated protein
VLDVRGLSSVTDYYLIATGNNAPHLKALAGEVDHALKETGRPHSRKSGSPESQWIAADHLDFVVHLFAAGARAYYDLEKLWSDAKRVD